MPQRVGLSDGHCILQSTSKLTLISTTNWLYDTIQSTVVMNIYTEKFVNLNLMPHSKILIFIAL